MHNAPGKIQNGHCTSHNICRGEEEPPCHTSKHALHLLRVGVLPPLFFSLLPIYLNLNMRVSPELQLCLCILQLKFTCSEVRFLEFYCAIVIVCIELYAITAGNTSKLPTLPNIISCLSLSWILNWENSVLRKIAFCHNLFENLALTHMKRIFWNWSLIFSWCPAYLILPFNYFFSCLCDKFLYFMIYNIMR